MNISWCVQCGGDNNNNNDGASAGGVVFKHGELIGVAMSSQSTRDELLAEWLVVFLL